MALSTEKQNFEIKKKTTKCFCRLLFEIVVYGELTQKLDCLLFEAA